MKGLTRTIIGAGLIAYSAYVHSERFSPAGVFKNQSTIIDYYIKDPKLTEFHYKRLKDELQGRKNAPAEELCKFDLYNSFRIIKGRDDAVQNAIEKRSLEPYEECKGTINRIKKDGPWTQAAGAVGGLAFLSGLLSSLSSLISFLRKRKPEPEIPIPSDTETDLTPAPEVTTPSDTETS